MNLDDAQRKIVSAWIAEGLKLSDIQNRLGAELGLRLTYMDVRLLVDDLKLTPKDAERPKAPASPLAATAVTPGAAQPASPPAFAGQPAAASAAGSISLSVDQITRAGAVVSGKVTFSDGNKADWYLDQAGRLGFAPLVQGYRPATADLQQFQMALETELAKLGL